MTNMFSLEQKNIQSSVVITQSKSPFGSDNPVSRVVRSTADDAAEKIKVSLIKKAETKPVIQAVYNIDTMLSDGTLTSGKMAAITGKRLCVLGEGASDGTGIFIVPCSETGDYKEDKSDWVQVADKDIHDNTMTKVLFRVPKDLSGWCRLCICTKAPLNGSKKKQDMLKKSRLAISGEIFSLSPLAPQYT